MFNTARVAVLPFQALQKKFSSFMKLTTLYLCHYHLFTFILQLVYPWKEILTSRPVWLCLNQRFVEAWTINFLLHCLPLFIKGDNFEIFARKVPQY